MSRQDANKRLAQVDWEILHFNVKDNWRLTADDPNTLTNTLADKAIELSIEEAAELLSLLMTIRFRGVVQIEKED